METTVDSKMEQMSIREYYAGKSIFVTGVTGFMGKILVEKLLRSCPDVKIIYALIRSKRGVTIEERWGKVTELPLFDKLKEIDATRLRKVKPIEGTIDESNLGLSDQNLNELRENVDIIFHGAAAVQFSEDLVFSLKNNTFGTYNMAETTRHFKKIKAFVYISTAYCNSDKNYEVEEKVHKSAFDWQVLLELVKTDPYSLAVLRDKIVGNHPTTYTLTKAVAEDIMEHYSQYYHVIISRPSVVMATVEDPFPGWIDVLNGVATQMMSVALGIVRVLNGRPSAHLDYISADHAIKGLIIAGWRSGISNKQNGTETMNVNYGKDMKMDNSWLINNTRQICDDFPSTKGVWYPFLLLIKNRFLFWIFFFILQLIPSMAVDTILKLQNKEPKLMNLMVKYAQLYCGPLKSFLNKTYYFPNNNFNKLINSIKEEDKDEFNIDLGKYSVKEIMYINCNGAYKYYLKELSMAQRRKHYEKLKKIHYATCAFLIFSTIMLIYKYIF